MLRVWCAVLVLAIVMVAPASADHQSTTDYVHALAPDQSYNGTVPFWVTWTNEAADDPADVTAIVITVAGVSTTFDITDETDLQAFLVTPPGFVSWTVDAFRGDADPTTDTARDDDTASGVTIVQDLTAEISAAFAGIDANVTDLVGRTDSLESDLAGLNATVKGIEFPEIPELPENVTVDLSDLEGELSSLEAQLLAMDGQEAQAVPKGASSNSLTTAGAMTGALVAIGVLVLVAIMQWQSNQRYQEQMVLILAMAARMKVGPESPEFQTALAAFEG